MMRPYLNQMRVKQRRLTTIACYADDKDRSLANPARVALEWNLSQRFYPATYP
jgi:hypothetical protein